jgi:hypothetical protein
MGMLKQYYNLIKIDENQAQRENLLMKRLTPDQISQHYQQWDMAAQNGDATKFAPNPDPQTGQPIPLDPPAVVPAHDYDNHAVHIEVHNRFRKSQSYDLLSDEVKAEFQKHIQSHQQALQSQMMMQTQGIMPPQPQSAGSSNPPAEQSGMTAQQLG